VEALAQAFAALGLKGEPARELAQRWVERELGSIKDLSQEEAEGLLAYLEELAQGLEPFPRVRRGEFIRVWLTENPKGAPQLRDLFEEEVVGVALADLIEEEMGDGGDD
jgi:hypothetical protein